MKKSNILFITVCLTIIGLLINACKKDEEQCPVVNCNKGKINQVTCNCECPEGFSGVTCEVSPPSLSGISPGSGPKNTLVTISGSNFGTNTDIVTVFFNEVEAMVQSVENDMITVLVPPGAFTGLVKVVIVDVTLIGPEFTYVISDIQVSTLAGSTIGNTDGTGANAQFYRPSGVAVDTQGNVYVGDLGNHSIRKINPDGVVSTLAGSIGGFADGVGDKARFESPYGVAVDADGVVFVADQRNHKIRKITPDGVVSTLAGSSEGFLDGMADNAQFKFPLGVAVDTKGTIYVADRENHKIRKINADGVVSTLAGSTQGFQDGTEANAQFNNPFGLTVDAEGNIYVVDTANHKIRKITPSGVVTTLAGFIAGFADGTGAIARFSSPRGVAIDADGNIYVADTGNHRIRKVTPEGLVSTLTGSTPGFADGMAAIAQFTTPFGVTIDAKGTLYVADLDNNRIRKIIQE